MKALVLLALLALPAEALEITFTKPTTKTDGSPFAVLFASGYEFRCSAVGTIGCLPVTVPVWMTSGTLAVVIPPAGGTVCVEGRTLAFGLNGPWSKPVCKEYSPSPPVAMPPGNIAIK